MRRLLALIGCITCITLVTVPAHAQQSITPECQADSAIALGREQRMFRSVLFGQKSPSDSPIGSVRFGKDGAAWLKTANNTWKSKATGYDGTTWTDTQMTLQAEFPARRGIFQVRKATTSELIPPILQSFRALQCRLKISCRLVQESLRRGLPATIRIEADGCTPMDLAPIASCSLTDDTSYAVVQIDACERRAAAILDHEQNVVQLAVAYDAAYRSLAQFAGTFEGFLTDFRFPLIEPLWQAVRAVSNIQGLPCFLAQCDQ